MLTSLEHAKQHGARIIAINPLPETGLPAVQRPEPARSTRRRSSSPPTCSARATPLADLHLPVRINGDIALLKGLMKVLLAEDERPGGVLDHDFIRDHTDGFAELYADLRGDVAGRTSWTAAAWRGRRSSGRAA